MRLLLLMLSLVLLHAGCASSHRATSASQADAYGRSPQRAIRVAGLDARSGPASERAYLDRLRGPGGEPVTYERQGRCCHFSTPNGFDGVGLLDLYVVQYEGLPKPVVLYLNMYDPPEGDLVAPEGFILAE